MLDGEGLSIGDCVEHAGRYKSLIFRMDRFHPPPLLILLWRPTAECKAGAARKRTAAGRIKDQHHERTLVDQTPKQTVLGQERGKGRIRHCQWLVLVLRLGLDVYKQSRRCRTDTYRWNAFINSFPRLSDIF